MLLSLRLIGDPNQTVPRAQSVSASHAPRVPRARSPKIADPAGPVCVHAVIPWIITDPLPTFRCICRILPMKFSWSCCIIFPSPQ
jgi:hypothetical protein